MRRRRDGFTLAEILVALTITGLVVMAAHGALATLSDAAAIARAARQPVQAGAGARAMLEGWLRNATLADSSGPFWGTHRVETGEEIDELSFSIADGGALRPGLHRVRLWVDRDLFTPSQGLMAEITPVLGGAPAPAETLAIAPSATGLAIRYLVHIDSRDR